jgi:hypothetical protein
MDYMLTIWRDLDSVLENDLARRETVTQFQILTKFAMM